MLMLVNAAARFALELAGIAAVGYWGYQAIDTAPARFVLAAAGVVALVVTWGVVIAPNASNAIPPRSRTVIGSGVLLLAAGALAVSGQAPLAATFGAAIILNTVLLFVLGHDVAATRWSA